MRKIALLLAVLVAALDVASNATQRSNPGTTIEQPSTHASERQQQTTCPGHGHEPGGAVVDINAMNGKPVSLYGKDPDVTKAVNDFQVAANRSDSGGRGVAAENYGPAGLWEKRQTCARREAARSVPRLYSHFAPAGDRIKAAGEIPRFY